MIEIKNKNQIVCGGADGKIRLFDYDTYKCVAKIKSTEQSIDKIITMPKGEIITCCRCGTIQIWNDKFELKKEIFRGYCKNLHPINADLFCT